MSAVSTPPEELRAPRLLLRKPRMADAAPLFKTICGDLSVATYMPWSVHASRNETEIFLERSLENRLAGRRFEYVIERLQGPANPIGTLALSAPAQSISCGYCFARESWGNGYAPEALQAVMDWALSQPDIWRFWAVCDIENLRSKRVLEKSGMAFEGILRRYLVAPNISSEPRDCRLYAKVRP